MAEELSDFNDSSEQNYTEDLHKNAEGRLLMPHEAGSPEQLAAIIANTKSVVSRRHIGQKAVETLTTDLL